MNIYLSTSMDDNLKMREVRSKLASLGHHVTSSWIDRDRNLEVLAKTDRKVADSLAREDFKDIRASDIFILYTAGQPSTRGGRYVELGYALALNSVRDLGQELVAILLVGPSTNVFTALWEVVWCETWDDVYNKLINGEV